MSAIRTDVLLDALAALHTARLALCKHPESLDAAMTVARAHGKLRAHMDDALPETIPVRALSVVPPEAA